MSQPKPLRVIDSHTGGEPTRVVVDGAPDLGGGTMAQRLAVLRDEHDWVRRACVLEPRGNDVIVGALLCEPVSPGAAAGVIFFNNVGYLHMCGHGTIGLAVTLAHMDRFGPGRHTIETPVGDVRVTLHNDQHTVSIGNVPSYRHRKDVPLDVPGHGLLHGDIAWGGNWFFLCHDHGLDVQPSNLEALTRLSRAIRKGLGEQAITGGGDGVIDHIELLGPPSESNVADGRSFTLCPGGAYDRSPCGTGTSATIACLAADGRLAEGEIWRQQSVIASIFEATYERIDSNRVAPTITGSAFVTADSKLILDPDDPFALGLD
ncbi:MAG: 4-hydroxyproline epimerase [Planctomycetota bacterium]